MKYTDVHKQILQGGSLSLADWFAEPVNTELAQAALSEIQPRLLAGRGSRQVLFNLRLAEIIFRYWAGYDIQASVENFSVVLDDQHERAMLELCYGQLLMACKQHPARAHLEHGFELAAHLLEPEDYFRVLRRHDLLRQLPLKPVPSPAVPLEALLDEARVIACLKGVR